MCMKLMKLFSTKGTVNVYRGSYYDKILTNRGFFLYSLFFESYVYIHMHNFATCIIHIYSLFLLNQLYNFLPEISNHNDIMKNPKKLHGYNTFIYVINLFWHTGVISKEYIYIHNYIAYINIIYIYSFVSLLSFIFFSCF